MSNDRRAVLVVGASRGLGEAIALDLAARGFLVGAACRRLEDADRVVEAIRERGGEGLPLKVDVSDFASIDAAAQSLARRSPGIAGLVNNAGLIEPIAPLIETDPGEWQRLITVNLVGAYFAVRAAAPLMSAGAIVNLSSGAASNAMEGWSAYCASKAGLAMLTRCIDHELGASDLAVYGYRPGLVDTGMQAQIRSSGLNPVSQVAQESLLSPALAASAVGWLVQDRPVDLRGQEVDIRDESFSSRIR